METDEVGVVRTVPTHTELERALSSVPGVDEVKVTLNQQTGRSRLRLRLARGEDAPTVSWAVSQTLRERFGIDLAPEAIRPRIAEADDEPTADAAPGLVVADGPAPEESVVEESAAEEPAAERRAAASQRTTTPDPDGQNLDTATDPGELADAPAELGSDIDGRDGDDASQDNDTSDRSEPTVVVTGDRDLLTEAARAIFPEVSDEPTTSATHRAEAEHARTGGEVADSGPGATGADDRQPVDAESEELSPDDDEGAVRGQLVQAPSSEAFGYTAHRVLIRDLDTRIDLSDVRVTATLTFHDRVVTGVASAVPTRHGILRAVAEATVEAVCQLTQTRLTVGVDAVSASVSGDPAIATVVVGVVTAGGEQPLLGASLVRNDPERAVMRATLDALNRRIAPWLAVELAG